MERSFENWQARLPIELQDMVIAPAYIESFHDDSIPASKWRGYDSSGEICYYRHTYTLWQECFDDEDQPYLRQLEAEALEAWRCTDGSWLRRLQRNGAAGECRSHTPDKGFERVAARDIPKF
ncbi:hypothetical protein [Uliginosibacterium sediminicola]|jgi:hypothetical protein|uniref:Uncharacterized protein n=1 Tax=Uliginosibacterium sediminicola TaxID=2024550 RepID=A0ABU9Z2Q5_9RHOO